VGVNNRLLPDKQVSYIRNSVKATVDAYDGTVTLYAQDEKDPVLSAWMKTFPGTIKPKSDITPELAAHLRYPEDLLRVQTAHLGKYHLNQADEFFNSDLRWCVSQDVPAEQSADSATISTIVSTPGVASSASSSSTKCSSGDRYVPYYSLFTPPGATQAEFSLIRPFAPFSPDDSLQVLRAFAVGPVGADLMPKLTMYDVQGSLPSGPYTAHLQIQSELSQAFTLEDSKGSKVLFGDMQMVPVGKGLVYVRPVYVKAEGQSAIPDLRYVVVIGNGSLGRGDSLTVALNALFPGAQVVLGDRSGSSGGTTGTTTPTTTPGGTTGPSGGETTVEQLLAAASKLFDEADAALKAGDLGTYQQKVTAARSKVTQAEALLGGSGSTTSTTTTLPKRSDSVSVTPTTIVSVPKPTA
jgi:uncharacterized membrane protein (UPF0182 family)